MFTQSERFMLFFFNVFFFFNFWDEQIIYFTSTDWSPSFTSKPKFLIVRGQFGRTQYLCYDLLVLKTSEHQLKNVWAMRKQIQICRLFMYNRKKKTRNLEPRFWDNATPTGQIKLSIIIRTCWCLLLGLYLSENAINR